MRRRTGIRAILLAGLITLSAVPNILWAQSGNQQPPFTIEIHLRQPTLKLGTHVVLDVQLINNSTMTKEVRVRPGVTFADPDYTAIVSDESGKVMPETPRGERLHGHGDDPRAIGGGSQFEVPIEPGGHIDQEYKLSFLYKLGVPNTYSIQLIRNDLIGNGEEVKSNTVRLTITPYLISGQTAGQALYIDNAHPTFGWGQGTSISTEGIRFQANTPSSPSGTYSWVDVITLRDAGR